MPSATTIIIAREDLSIPGGDPSHDPAVVDAGTLESRFFDLLHDAKPDVVVLDLSKANGSGAQAIRRIRRHSVVPILVVCGDARNTGEYRTAGATDCVSAPIDVVTLNQALQQIVRVTRAPEPGRRDGVTFSFAGMTFVPQHNVVIGGDGVRAQLTSAESRLFAHLVAHPWEVQTRVALAEALYGRHRPATDRAIDVVVNRLRKKLAPVGVGARDLIKTEFRCGYRFVNDVSAEP